MWEHGQSQKEVRKGVWGSPLSEVFDRPIQSQDDLDAALEQLRDALQKLIDEGAAIILE